MRLCEKRRMSPVMLGIRSVRVEGQLVNDGAKNRVFAILDIASEFVLVPGEELWMTGQREMQDLGNDASQSIVSCLDSNSCGLEDDVNTYSGGYLRPTNKTASCAAPTQNNPFRVDTEGLCILLALKTSQCLRPSDSVVLQSTHPQKPIVAILERGWKRVFRGPGNVSEQPLALELA